MQTGNTISLAARLAGEPATQHKYHWLKSMTAILSYLLGSLVFGTIAQIETRKQYIRWRVFLVTLLQTLSLLVCAGLAQSHIVSNRASSSHNIFSSGSKKKNDV